MTSVPGDHMGSFQDLLGPPARAGGVPKLDEQMPGGIHHRTRYWELLQRVGGAPVSGQKRKQTSEDLVKSEM